MHVEPINKLCWLQAKLLVTPEVSQGKAAGEITQVAASPTGSHIAAGHADGTIRIWNLESGDCEVHIFVACALHAFALRCIDIKFHAISAVIALGCLGQGEGGSKPDKFPMMQVTLTGHRRAVTALRYSRNGSQLASGSQDTDVILWDVIAESGLFRLRAHTAEVTDLVGLPSSSLLFAMLPAWMLIPGSQP